MRISAFFVLAAYLAANAYVAARTSIFLHRNLPERVAKLVSLLTAGVYSVFAMGMPLGYILPEGTLRKAIMRVSFGFYGIFIYLFSAYALIEVLARLSKRFHRTEKLTARRGNPKLIFGGAVWFGIILTCILGIHHASELTVKRYDAEVAKDGGGPARGAHRGSASGIQRRRETHRGHGRKGQRAERGYRSHRGRYL